MKVAVVGAGYVGCVSAACLASKGDEVWLVETGRERLEKLRRGVCPVVEEGLDDLFESALLNRGIHIASDLCEAIANTELMLVCVGTPSATDGDIDSRDLVAVMETVAESVTTKESYVVAVRSTVDAPTLEREIFPILRDRVGSRLGPEIGFAVHPEFLRQGNAISDFRNPPFLLIGTEHGIAARKLEELFGSADLETLVVAPGTASLIKYASNSFHALKITFANEVDAIAPLFGADGDQVMDILCKDRRLNISDAYLRPGFAFGGSCLVKDLSALNRAAESEGVETPVLASIVDSNQKMVRKALRSILQLSPKVVGMFGISFKPGTGDTRSSPLLELARELSSRGVDLRIHDPDVTIESASPEIRDWIQDDLRQAFDADLVVVGKKVGNPEEFLSLLPDEGRVLDLAKHPEFKKHPAFFHLGDVVQADGARASSSGGAGL